MHDQLAALGDEARRSLADATTPDALEAWRVRFLGRRGAIGELLRQVTTLPVAERPAFGAAANALKDELEAAFESRRAALDEERLAEALAREAIDVTLPGRPVPTGGLHPTSRMIREISDIFQSLGFDVVDGPEVEWDYYNFEALNIPPGHPARDMWDTFWLTPPDSAKPMLLRTHTSPMQVRWMERHKPPVRIIVPGRCFRYEATDATHEWHFFQIEGLAVDEGITFADLKGTLYEFARRIFGP
ncbi:MAG: phenylalanine--tRNA ligase subunit alpha, partial [Dehalococcoidia bacterium]|nr:phenylalanine--tRNA ligase subunit alpha [Dehalococcoidia bacterium]